MRNYFVRQEQAKRSVEWRSELIWLTYDQFLKQFGPAVTNEPGNHHAYGAQASYRVFKGGHGWRAYITRPDRGTTLSVWTEGSLKKAKEVCADMEKEFAIAQIRNDGEPAWPKWAL